MVFNILATLLIFCSGFCVGRLTRSRKPPQVVKDPSICSCTHPYSYHTDKGKCNCSVHQLDNGQLLPGYHCPCLRYDGVVPGHLFLNEGDQA